MKRTRRRGGADDENETNEEIEANMHAQNNMHVLHPDAPDAVPGDAPDAVPGDAPDAVLDAVRVARDPDDRANAGAEMAQRHESIRNRNPRSLRYEQDRVGMERELEAERQRNLPPPVVVPRIPRPGLQEQLVLLLTQAIDLAVAIPAEATLAPPRPPRPPEPDHPDDDDLYD